VCVGKNIQVVVQILEMEMIKTAVSENKLITVTIAFKLKLKPRHEKNIVVSIPTAGAECTTWQTCARQTIQHLVVKTASVTLTTTPLQTLLPLFSPEMSNTSLTLAH
jgi:hypothetical protein